MDKLLKPILVSPSRGPSQVHEGAQTMRLEWIEGLIASGAAFGRSLGNRIYAIPQEALKICRDGQWMRVLLQLLRVTSKACEMGGSASAENVPYLNLFAAPLFLYHASNLAYYRLKVMALAVKTHNVAGSFFWLTRGIDGIGIALGNATKSLSAGIQLAGLDSVHAVGLIFSTIVPIVLMAAGGVGGLSKGWALWRNAKLLKKMEQMGELGAFLTLLQGSTLVRDHEDEDTEAAAKDLFQHADFVGTHFTNFHRFEVIEEKMRLFLTEKKINNAPMPHTDLGAKVQQLFADLAAGTARRDQILEIANSLEEAFQDPKLVSAWAGHEALVSDLMLQVRADVSRQMLYNAFYILLAMMILTSGTLYVVAPGSRAIASSLAITTSVLEIGKILFDKKIDEKKFEALFRSWKGLPDSSGDSRL